MSITKGDEYDVNKHGKIQRFGIREKKDYDCIFPRERLSGSLIKVRTAGF